MGKQKTSKGTIIGNYQLLSKIGQGGMGEVFCARSINAKNDSELVAIKILQTPNHDDPLKIKHFRDEALLLSTLKHKNIVATKEAGLFEDQLYIVMDFVFGIDLGSLLDELDRQNLILPLPIALYIAEQLLDALEYLHNAQSTSNKPLELIHRDVCPPNIFLSFSGDVLLGDFGIAIHHAHSENYLYAGHLGYLAPEQVLRKKLDQRVDIFAISAVIFEIISNVQAFLRDDRQESYQATFSTTIPDIKQLDKKLQRRLKKFIQRGCHSKVHKRIKDVYTLKKLLHDTFGSSHIDGTPLANLINSLFYKSYKNSYDIIGSSKKNKVSCSLVGIPSKELLDCFSFLNINAAYFDPEKESPPNVIFCNLDAYTESQGTINESNHIIAAGKLNKDILAQIATIQSAKVIFEPYQPELLYFYLHQSFNKRNDYNRKRKIFQENSLANKRILVISQDVTYIQPIIEYTAKNEIICEYVEGFHEIFDMIDNRSYHLVLYVVSRSCEECFANIQIFRSMFGIGLTPFVVISRDKKDKTCEIHRPQQAYVFQDLEHATLLKINDLLSNYTHRINLRYPTQLECSYQINQQEFTGTFFNISRMGGLLKTSHLLPLGTKFDLSLDISNSNEMMKINNARVVHIELSGQHASDHFYLGIDFSLISQEQERKWLKIVQDYAKRYTALSSHGRELLNKRSAENS